METPRYLPPNPKVDKMPPSRISDLRLTSDESGSKLVALWTAPGDDYDNGNVSKYNFILSEYITDLLDASNDPPILQELIRSDLAGTKANFSFTFTKNYDTDYHIAMYAVDDSGNKANVSNIVLIRLPKPESTTKDPLFCEWSLFTDSVILNLSPFRCDNPNSNVFKSYVALN